MLVSCGPSYYQYSLRVRPLRIINAYTILHWIPTLGSVLVKHRFVNHIYTFDAILRQKMLTGTVFQGRSQKKKLRGGPNLVTFKSDVHLLITAMQPISPHIDEKHKFFVEFLSKVIKLIAKLC